MASFPCSTFAEYWGAVGCWTRKEYENVLQSHRMDGRVHLKGEFCKEPPVPQDF